MMPRIGLLAMLLLVPGPVRADFEAELRAAEALCRNKQHEAAIQAYLRLGQQCADIDERFQAVRAAAVCARLHLGSEARALAVCDQPAVEPYRKACRVAIYEWATAPEKVVAEFGKEDFSAWPESLAAMGYAVRGQAYFRVKNGPAAAQDFVRAFQCSKSFAKWAALGRLGDTFWRLLDDELLAEACYRKCMTDFKGGWPGLQARINLGDLLCTQQRYDAALQCLAGAPEVGGYWKVALQLSTARVHLAAGQQAEARAVLRQTLAIAGLSAGQKAECEQLLAKLK